MESVNKVILIGNWGGNPFFRSRKRWKKRDQDRERRYLKRGLNPPINLPF